MMYEHANRLNKRFCEKAQQLDTELLNTIIEFGRVAKYRCRSNTAYRNFVAACFQHIAEITEETGEDRKDGRQYTYLQAVKQ